MSDINTLRHRAHIPKRYWNVTVKANSHERKQVREYVRHLGVGRVAVEVMFVISA